MNNLTSSPSKTNQQPQTLNNPKTMKTYSTPRARFFNGKVKTADQSLPVGDDDGVSTSSLNVLIATFIVGLTLMAITVGIKSASAKGRMVAHSGGDIVNNDMRIVLRQAVQAMEEGRYAQALTALLEVQAKQPTNCRVKHLIGECFLYGMNQPELAIPYFKAASASLSATFDRWDIDSQEAPFTALFNLGKALQLSGEYAEAIAAYTEFLGHLKPSKGAEGRRLYTAVVYGITDCRANLNGAAVSHNN